MKSKTGNTDKFLEGVRFMFKNYDGQYIHFDNTENNGEMLGGNFISTCHGFDLWLPYAITFVKKIRRIKEMRVIAQ